MMIVHCMVGFREVCKITAVLPFLTLVTCFCSAILFQFDEVHETHCRVFNVIPSISAVTGISPQRYLWRICIALHIVPRFVIAACYKSQYLFQLFDKHKDKAILQRGTTLINWIFWLHFVEISALTGVTYISNVENYPIHEKIFIVFMTSSLCHMLATLKLNDILYSCGFKTIDEKRSHTIKQRLFWTSIISTVGLLVFFYKHRFYCHDMAFSWFALCEYIIACSNMAFHCTTILDFPTEQFIMAKGFGQNVPTNQMLNFKLD